MLWNTQTTKQTILLNDAGDNQYNPILSGLDFTLKVRFNESVYAISGLVDTTPITFVVDLIDILLYICSATAGIAPFTAGEHTVKITFTDTATGKETTWEKKIYIAALPVDAIQAWDVVTGAWVSVNFDTTPSTIPQVSQQCPIRFLNSWYDEFSEKHYGGVSVISVHDYGTTESDWIEQYVHRIEEQEITRVNYIYLVRHAAEDEEIHDIAITVKSHGGGTAVIVKIKVKTICCVGFEFRNPIIE